MENSSQILLFHKPFRVLCQFTSEGNGENKKECLADYIHISDIYAAGRLDYDSEGLLVLTDNGQLAHRITDPQHKLEKTYLVQVEGVPDEAALDALRSGIVLKDGMTKPALAELLKSQPEWIGQRNPPIRERKNIPTSWIRLTISEGRNRQVRRMTAAAGFPTLRLIREQIGPWSVQDLELGAHRWQELDSSIWQGVAKSSPKGSVKSYTKDFGKNSARNRQRRRRRG